MPPPVVFGCCTVCPRPWCLAPSSGGRATRCRRNRHAHRAAPGRRRAGPRAVGGLRRRARGSGLGDRSRSRRPTTARTPCSSRTRSCVHGGLAVLTRPGAASRRPELEGAEEAARSLGFGLERIEAPGTLDGGDVLVVGRRRSTSARAGGRTPQGARQLGALLGLLGASREVPVARRAPPEVGGDRAPRRHGRRASAARSRSSALPRVPGRAGAVGRARRRARRHSRCWSRPTARARAELYASLGFEPVVVDIGEFQKLEGCVTCLSVLVKSLT